MCITNSFRLYLFTTINSNLEIVTAEIGDLSHIFSSTYSDIAKLLQYYIDNGYLPDVNLVALIPTLLATNSNILANGDNVSYPAWYSFDNSDSTKFITNNAGDYIGYIFANPVLVKKITWKGADSGYKGFSNSAKLQASSDNSAWIDIQNISGGATYNVLETRSITGSTKYRYWRVIDSGARYGLASMQFYGN